MPAAGLRTHAKLYVGMVVLVGGAAIAESFYRLYSDPIGWKWIVLAVLTLVSGSATVKLPSVPATITVSETFVFTSVLLFGTAAGTLTVTLDALVISFWLARKGHPVYRVLFNVGALPVAMWVGAHLFFALADVPPLAIRYTPLPVILWPLLVFTIVYFSLNSGLIAVAISLERGGSPLRIWRDNFAWLSLNYFGGASVAALLGSYTRSLEFTHLAVIVPLLLVLYLTFTASMGRAEDANRHLVQLNALYMSTIETLAMAIDAKDQITHGHIRRVQHYAVELAKAVGIKDEAQIRAIEAAALLHDMGKLAVPEYILNKPGPLTPTEFEKMKLHASVGADILSSIKFPYPVVPIVRHHHESWDGTGYPDGLKGAEIPIGARVLSVVDCFDALTSDRPYRPRLPDSEALKVLLDRRAKMYDPLVVDTFVRVHSELAPRELPSAPPRDALLAISEAAQPPSGVAGVPRLEEISASTEEMLTLYELAKGLSGHSSLSDVGDVIFKHLRRILPGSTCVFFVYDVDGDELLAAHAAGEHAQVFQGLRIPLGQRLTGWVAANRQTISNSDPVLDLGEISRNLKPRLRSCLSTPLLIKNELVGVLSMYSAAREAFSDDHRRVVEAVSGQVAQTVRQALDFEKAKTARFQDALTGLPHFEQAKALFGTPGDDELRYPFALLVLDVDGLKAINLRFGRAAGDDILEEVAASTRRALRAADLLLRSGSDEFVVVLFNTDRTASTRIAAHVGTTVDNALQSAQHGDRKCSVSVSFAAAPDDGLALDDLLTVARRRVSSAERSKRDSSADSGEAIH